eukprot:snap_masked-scaffold_3-processed-gene-14.31-mRNA-1 protein AED:1.00 eAED:1.00 QI:0/0/0/0/1/1/2/0/170
MTNEKVFKKGRWSRKEHNLFIDLLKIHGKTWKEIAKAIKGRDVAQIRTHAQKFFKKMYKEIVKAGYTAPGCLNSVAQDGYDQEELVKCLGLLKHLPDLFMEPPGYTTRRKRKRTITIKKEVDTNANIFEFSFSQDSLDSIQIAAEDELKIWDPTDAEKIEHDFLNDCFGE